MSRYIVAIDLGTTNSALAYVDRDAPDAASIQIFPIQQLVGPGEIDARSTLPSFVLLPTEHEVPMAQLALPWAPRADAAVGRFARERGAELPARVVSSAKSWLSYAGCDRSSAILPWQGSDPDDADVVRQISPVDSSARYLGHLRAAWDDAHPDDPLAEQEIYLTVPASFDAVARELTVGAAVAAGIAEPVLLEEPQAAFYSWLGKTGDLWRETLAAGDVVLVCDVGGGTTDFSLIEVSEDETGSLALERIAVGDHILLGGDNVDIALAHQVSLSLSEQGTRLKTAQFRSLLHACRRAKEQLLDAMGPEEVPITLHGTSSRLIGGTIRATITREAVESMVLEGFFPEAQADELPRSRRALGLRELGLPYAQDAAVTRHLAGFLARHGRTPTAVLWNGGMMKASLIRDRVAETVARWFDKGSLPTLGGTDLELACAHGAAYYGLVRQGRGIRIRGGAARSYYIGIEESMPAIPGFDPPVKGLCVAPVGQEEGSHEYLDTDALGLVVGETAIFRFFASSDRPDDPVGCFVDPVEAALVELPPVEASLSAQEGEAGTVVSVGLEAHLTEIGTLALYCVGRGPQEGRRWKLEYNVRDEE